MSDFNIQFEEQDQSITLEFEQIGGGAVKSVNGKTGAVVLDAGDLEYDDTETYSSGSVGDELSTLKDGLDAVTDQINATLITDTASGAIASFPDGADGIPVKSLTVDAESGHTQAVVTRTGVNVWDEVGEVGNISNVNGQNNDLGTNRWRSKNYIPVKPNTNYYMLCSSGVAIFAYWYDAGKNFIGMDTEGSQSAKTVLSPSNAVYMRFRTNDNYGTAYGNNISINYPSTDTAYHAYNGQTVTIDLNGGSSETDITTIKGQNNIWADTGDVEVEYRADTKLYIQKVMSS